MIDGENFNVFVAGLLIGAFLTIVWAIVFVGVPIEYL